MRLKTTLSILTAAAVLATTLGGCYILPTKIYADWPEYRIKRAGDDNGVMVAKVKRRGEKAKWPGDSYEVLVRWPTNLEFVPRGDLSVADRKKEAEAFLATLCGENKNIYVINESFNDRTGEIYYSLWCRPPEQG